MTVSINNIQVIQQALASVPGPCRIHVGLSGGLDSTVLLHMVRAWWQVQPADRRPSLHAIHINHQLQADSDGWARQCLQLCEQWDVPCTTIKVTVDVSQPSLEQQARMARYRAFDDQIGPGEVLLLAHHRDDQVETLLQRLARGSGPLGLGAMQVASMRGQYSLLRPLLELDRAQLEHYAVLHQLAWVDDPSNQDDRLERNFLRNQVLPLWRGSRTGLNQTLARSARLCQESAELLDQLAELDLGWHGDKHGMGRGPERGSLPIATLLPLTASRRNNALRYWLRQQGLPPPSEAVLEQISTDLMLAAPDAQPLVSWGDNSVRRFQSALYCFGQTLPEWLDDVIALELPAGLVSVSSGLILNLPVGGLHFDQGGTLFSRAALQQNPLTIGFRQGGERLQLPGRPLKPLKDLFQERAVAPWLRNIWPILYSGEQIIGLPGLLVCEGFQPQSPTDALALTWIRGAIAQD